MVRLVCLPSLLSVTDSVRQHEPRGFPKQKQNICIFEGYQGGPEYAGTLAQPLYRNLNQALFIGNVDGTSPLINPHPPIM